MSYLMSLTGSIGIGSLALVLAIMTSAGTSHAQILVDSDFEDGTLNGWTLGGRRAYGESTATVLEDITGDHFVELYKYSFTEVTLSRSFPFSPDLRVKWDMEVATDVSPAGVYGDAAYGMAGVMLSFRDASGAELGEISYLTASSPVPFSNDTPTHRSLSVLPGRWGRYSFDMRELTGQLAVDEAQIDSVLMTFIAYSSVAPLPHVQAAVWFDNVYVSTLRTFGIIVGVNDGANLRGDIAAQKVFDQLASQPSWASFEDGNTAGPIQLGQNETGGLAQLVQARQRIESAMLRPGDRFVFFFNGHSGVGPIGDPEAPVDIEVDTDGDRDFQEVELGNTDDEVMFIGADRLPDDLITGFSEPAWDPVTKIFILDTCYAMGFADFDSGDEGILGNDTETPNTYIYGASAEGRVSRYGGGDKPYGLLSDAFLSSGVLRSGLDLEQLDAVMAGHKRAFDDRYAGVTMGVATEPGDVGPYEFAPILYASSDIDPEAPIFAPEPNTTLMLSVGILGIAVRATRRAAAPG